MEVATRPAAESKFRRGKLGGSRADRGVDPEHVTEILRLNNMEPCYSYCGNDEPVVKCVDTGVTENIKWCVDVGYPPLSNVQKIQFRYLSDQARGRTRLWIREVGGGIREGVYQGNGVLQSCMDISDTRKNRAKNPTIMLLSAILGYTLIISSSRDLEYSQYILRSSSSSLPDQGRVITPKSSAAAYNFLSNCCFSAPVFLIRSHLPQPLTHLPGRARSPICTRGERSGHKSV